MHVNIKRIASFSPNPHSSAFLTSPNFPLDAWMEPVLTRGGSSLRWSKVKVPLALQCLFSAYLTSCFSPFLTSSIARAPRGVRQQLIVTRVEIFFQKSRPNLHSRPPAGRNRGRCLAGSRHGRLV